MEGEGRLPPVIGDNVSIEAASEIFLKIVFLSEEAGLIGLPFKPLDAMEVEKVVSELMFERFLRRALSTLLAVVGEQ